MGLEDKKNTPAQALSGGMKRKLQVAIALLGNSRVVLLDEPTSGRLLLCRADLWPMQALHLISLFGQANTLLCIDGTKFGSLLLRAMRTESQPCEAPIEHHLPQGYRSQANSCCHCIQMLRIPYDCTRMMIVEAVMKSKMASAYLCSMAKSILSQQSTW